MSIRARFSRLADAAFVRLESTIRGDTASTDPTDPKTADDAYAVPPDTIFGQKLTDIDHPSYPDPRSPKAYGLSDSPIDWISGGNGEPINERTLVGQSGSMTPSGFIAARNSLTDDSPADYEIAKAQDRDAEDLGFTQPSQQAKAISTNKAKGIYWDPFSLVEQLGYKERPSAITYPTLQAMVWKLPLVHAIVQTRLNQIASFCIPQSNKFDTGFRIMIMDAERHPTRIEKKKANELMSMMLHSGVPDPDHRRDTFDMFVRRIMRDSLIYDACAYEIVEGNDGLPSAWYGIDASTIRLADAYTVGPSTDLDSSRYVQIYDQVVVNEFTGRELAYGIRNPRTDIRSQGYGTPELEMVVSTVTHLLWAQMYNANNFAQGSLQRGILNLKGVIPEKQLRAFRRQWYQMVSGVENSGRTPITNAEEIQWINLHQSNKEMEYGAWADYLIKIICGIFLIDPLEINFKFGGTGAKCYAPETEVLMFDGSSRRVDTVRVGDQVMGPDSTPRNVLGLTRGTAEMWSVYPAGVSSWSCNGAHQLCLVSPTGGVILDVTVDDYLQDPRAYIGCTLFVVDPAGDHRVRAGDAWLCGRKVQFTIRRAAAGGPFVGFETDGDHRHLLASGLVSHNSMFGAADRAKMTESKERGLRPLLRFIERMVNQNIIWRIAPEYKLEFVGLQSQTPKELADLTTQRVRTMYMIDEIRAENDLPPLKDGLGQVILDANWLAHKRELDQQKKDEEEKLQAATQAAMPGALGTPPPPTPPMPPPGGTGPKGAPDAPPAPSKEAKDEKELPAIPSAVEIQPGGATPAARPAPITDEEASTPQQKKELRNLLQPAVKKSQRPKAIIHFTVK